MSASSRSSSDRARGARRWAIAAVSVAAAALSAAAARAQTKVGTTIGSFMMIEPSARIAALGNAGVTLPEGLDAVYYNPAAIARNSRFGVQFSHSPWFADIAYNYVVTALPMGRWGNAFGSVTALSSGDMPVRTVDQPLGTGEQFGVNDVALTLGWGREITDRFAMGAQVTYMQETIWHSSAGATAFGFGTLYQVSDHGLRIGASLSNFGTEAEFSGRDLRVTFDEDPSRNGDNGTLPASQFTDAFALPVLFRVGLGQPIRLNSDQQLLLVVDAKHPSDNTESVSGGAELTYRNSLSLRWGYQDAFQQDSEVGLTFGAGVEADAGSRHLAFDYGWSDHGRLGNVNRFTLTLLF